MGNKFFWTLLFICLVVPRVSTSATYFVDVANTTSIEDGSSVSPFNTIQEALNVAVNGDEVIVAQGTYIENLNITSSIQLKSSLGTSTYISSPTGSTNPVANLNANNIYMKGFIIRNSTIGIYITGIGAVIDNCLVERNVKNITIYGGGARISNSTIIGHSSSDGIDISGSSSGTSIINNKISGNAVGIIIDNSIDVSVRGNEISYNKYGFAVSRLPYAENPIRIYNNNFIGNKTHVYQETYWNPLVDPRLSWHNTYKFGGNYWDSWIGPDENNDNIVDQPYFHDFFPVTQPYGWENIQHEHNVKNITSNQAYSTIDEAISAAMPGDKIKILGGGITGRGNYYETINIDKKIDLFSGDGVVTITSAYPRTAKPALTISAAGTSVDGLRFKDSNYGVNVISNSVTVQDCSFERNYSTNIQISGANCQIKNNRVENGVPNSTGILFYGYPGGGEVTGNIITAQGVGINIDGSKDILVRNNDITRNKIGVSLIRRHPFGASGTLYNNNFIANEMHVYKRNDYNMLGDGQFKWHNGYSVGGNYWDTWREPDAYSGPDQSIYGADGIVDQPYFNDLYPYTTPNGWLPKNTLPVANAGSDLTFYVGETFVLDASASYDSDGSLTKFTWSSDVGVIYEETNEFASDGSFDGKTEYQYNSTGDYEITLTVVDNSGGSASDKVTVKVISPSEGADVISNKLADLGLPSGPTTALTGKLDDVKSLLANGDSAGALNTLQALSNQISAPGFGKKYFTPEEQALILAEIQRLIQSI